MLVDEKLKALFFGAGRLPEQKRNNVKISSISFRSMHDRVAVREWKTAETHVSTFLLYAKANVRTLELAYNFHRPTLT